MHELDPAHFPLASAVDEDGGETDVAMDKATVHREETDGFLYVFMCVVIMNITELPCKVS